MSRTYASWQSLEAGAAFPIYSTPPKRVVFMIVWSVKTPPFTVKSPLPISDYVPTAMFPIPDNPRI